jgi:hypothetical protein
MRSRECLLCFVVVVAVGLLATPAAAQEECTFPDCCETDNWKIVVSEETPCQASCDSEDWKDGICGSLPEGATEVCTAIEYEVQEKGRYNADHVVTLTDDDVTVVYPSEDGGNNSAKTYPPCVGDSRTGVGQFECHQQTIRMNDDFSTGKFWVVVEGANPLMIDTSIVVNAGNRTESCKISTLGPDTDSGACVPSCGNFNKNQTITKTEILDFKGCKAQFEFYLDTGAVASFGLAEMCADLSGGDLEACCAEYPKDPWCCEGPYSSELCCEETDFDTAQLAVTIPGGTPQVYATFGDGLLSIGPDSCSCRVIGGRVYCWGRPCPQ